MAFDLLRVAVLLIPNLLVFCANFSPKLNSSPRLRASAVQLVFSGFSPCLSAVACPEVRRRVVGFDFGLIFDFGFLCALRVLCGKTRITALRSTPSCRLFCGAGLLPGLPSRERQTLRDRGIRLLLLLLPG